MRPSNKKCHRPYVQTAGKNKGHSNIHTSKTIRYQSVFFLEFSRIPESGFFIKIPVFQKKVLFWNIIGIRNFLMQKFSLKIFVQDPVFL